MMKFENFACLLLKRFIINAFIFVLYKYLLNFTAKSIAQVFNSLQKFEEIAKRGKTLAIMTFGSFVNTTAMPKNWKNAFLNSFK